MYLSPLLVQLFSLQGFRGEFILPVAATGGTLVAALLWAAVYAQDFMVEKLGFNPYQFERIYSWLDPYSYISDEGIHLFHR